MLLYRGSVVAKSFIAGNLRARPIGTRVIDSTPRRSRTPGCRTSPLFCEMQCLLRGGPALSSIEVAVTLSGRFEGHQRVAADIVGLLPPASPAMDDSSICGCVAAARAISASSTKGEVPPDPAGENVHPFGRQRCGWWRRFSLGLTVLPELLFWF